MSSKEQKESAPDTTELGRTITKIEKRIIALDNLVDTHHECLNKIFKALADIEKRWYELTGIYLDIFKAMRGMNESKEILWGNDEFIDKKMGELEGVWKGFIKKYYQDGHPHSDKKTNKFTITN